MVNCIFNFILFGYLTGQSMLRLPYLDYMRGEIDVTQAICRGFNSLSVSCVEHPLHGRSKEAKFRGYFKGCPEPKDEP
jgi:hypothetical protein